MKWEKVKLGELCVMNSGGTPRRGTVGYYEGEIPWAKISDIEDAIGGVIFTTEEYITQDGLKSIGNRVFPKGTLLLAMYGSVGKTAIAGIELSTNQAILGIRIIDPTKLNIKYLKYWLGSIKEQLLDRAVGGTLQNISLGIVKELFIPLPPIHIQEQIADTLDKADALRRKDQELLTKYDELAQAIFFDMFGDPVNNSKKWGLKLFNEVGTLDRGVSKHRPRNAPELLGGKYPLIQTGDVANCNGYITEFRQTYSDIGLKQSKLWPKGTLCITIAANIAKTGILNFDACFPDSIVGFRPNNFVTVNYVRFWIGFLQKILEDSAPESAQKNINLEILRNLKIPVPPIDLQESFEQKLTKILDTKDVTIQSSVKGQSFFNSLNNKYFS